MYWWEAGLCFGLVVCVLVDKPIRALAFRPLRLLLSDGKVSEKRWSDADDVVDGVHGDGRLR